MLDSGRLSARLVLCAGAAGLLLVLACVCCSRRTLPATPQVTAPSTVQPPSLPDGFTLDLTRAAVRLPDGVSWPMGAAVNEKDGSVLVFVAAGEAVFGSRRDDEDAWSSEKPQFRASLPAYWIGVHPVTHGQYAGFVEQTHHRPPVCWRDGKLPPDVGDRPMSCLAWDDARAYCEWAGLRMPSELEWEKAARGTDGRTYPWGNEWDASRCQAERTSAALTDLAVVGAYPSGASPYGLLDMAGGVREWCADWEEPDAYRRYARGDLSPPATGNGGQRGARGSAWGERDPSSYRCARRLGAPPEWDNRPYGARVARDP